MKKSNEKNTIEEYLKPQEEKRALQAKVNSTLYERAEKKRRELDRTWVEILEACLEAFVEGEIK